MDRFSLPWAFGTEIYLSAHNERKNDSATKHESPAEIGSKSAESDAHNVPQHDTWNLVRDGLNADDRIVRWNTHQKPSTFATS